MEIGLDSFGSAVLDENTGAVLHAERSMTELLDRIAHADRMGLDVFGMGEHHRPDYFDSSPVTILAAAAARTERIKLTSAVTVLSAADPVRVFQAFATLDLISRGRTEMTVGRGSFIDAFPLFGYDLAHYDELFTEKLDLLLQIRDNRRVTWSGRFRPALNDQPIYPRPAQDPLPIWLGVGGTPASFSRAGTLGLPLMVAVIGGETHRFRPLVDRYREAWHAAGHDPAGMRVGLHSLGYVAETTEQAVEDFYPGHTRTMNKIGRERGWRPQSRPHFDAQRGPLGALLVGGPEEVAEKILRHSEALGGIDRLTFQMDSAELSHQQRLRAIELIGQEVAPRVKAAQFV
ncbi:putative LLM family oxidoreductase [Lewinella marina]|uniref:LLM class flavin-dependent oxidoreductase n=1 Tax=Neolewinella marina TaxID=438751 RepID=A0A2G0CGT1_9BACT|nr:LLM class flavin-dependent oxidoreductase [Neolewinella marina]NJB86349.1 putative LLM family oxidoreductase [Neolewinella marina]PHK99182.1 LLM class flavin-dependent oxidoreductase [Neolewinella marina]